MEPVVSHKINSRDKTEHMYITIPSLTFDGLYYVIRKQDSYVNLTNINKYYIKYTKSTSMLGNWKSNKKTMELIKAIEERTKKSPIDIEHNTSPHKTFAHPTLALHFAIHLDKNIKHLDKKIFADMKCMMDSHSTAKRPILYTENEPIKEHEYPSESSSPPEIIMAEVLKFKTPDTPLKANMDTQTDAADYTNAPFVPPTCNPMNPREDYLVVKTTDLRIWIRDYKELKRFKEEHKEEVQNKPLVTEEPQKKRCRCPLDLMKEERDRVRCIAEQITNYYKNDFSRIDELKEKLTELEIVHLLQFSNGIENGK